MEQALWCHSSGDQPGTEGSDCRALPSDAQYARRLHSTVCGLWGRNPHSEEDVVWF